MSEHEDLPNNSGGGGNNSTTEQPTVQHQQVQHNGYVANNNNNLQHNHHHHSMANGDNKSQLQQLHPRLLKLNQTKSNQYSTCTNPLTMHVPFLSVGCRLQVDYLALQQILSLSNSVKFF